MVGYAPFGANPPYSSVHQTCQIARVLDVGPGQALVDLKVRRSSPNRGRAGRLGSCRTHGPRCLATSRLVEVLCPPTLLKSFGATSRKSANTLGVPRTVLEVFAAPPPMAVSISGARG